VTTVVVDKTGTLTEGKPVVTDFVPGPDAARSRDETLRLIASIETLSEHPLATAIVRHAREKGRTLATPFGTMHGSYRMSVRDGEDFDAEIAAFTLAEPHAVH
jgi:cation transport ATPase